MWNKIDKVAKVEVFLKLGINQGSNEVKVSNKICRCRFTFDESVLTGIEFELKMV